jgi:hypothetical protein
LVSILIEIFIASAFVSTNSSLMEQAGNTFYRLQL